MSDGVWAAQLVDPDGHEETISSADPNTIVWWLERQAQRLDPKPKGTYDPLLNGYVRCAVGEGNVAPQKDSEQLPVLRPDRCWAAQCSTPWECTAAGRCPQAPLNAP